MNYVTYYTYNALNQLDRQVSMTRGAVTQTRTFSFTGRDMVSATNPENGTVTYAYDAVHRVTSRVDAKGQETQYDYDSYGRQTQVRHYPTSGTEDLTQRASYYYDGNDPCGSTTPTNGAGRLTAVSYSLGSNLSLQNNGIFDNYCYSYGYSGPGRITSEQMKVGSGNTNWSGVGRLTMASSYQWDNEGRMTSQQYPAVWLPQYTGPTTLQTAGYQYDANGRINTMTWDAGYGPTTFATATYGAAGEMLSLSYGAGTEYADVQQPAATDESIAIRVHEYDVQLSGDGEQRADRGVGGLGGWGDDVVQLRWGEPADRGVEQFVVGDVWVRRVWESDVEERDGRGALDDGVVRRGEPSGGEQLRREWESVVWGEHEQLVQCGESDDRVRRQRRGRWR